jgi:hypothetical protein
MTRISSEPGTFASLRSRSSPLGAISREPANSSNAPSSATQPPGLTLISPPASDEMPTTISTM